MMAGIALLCLGLGQWQVIRLGEKNRMRGFIDRGFYAPPLPLDTVLEGPVLSPDAQYRPVFLTGRYATDLSLKWMAKVKGGRVGFYVLTPLTLADGTMIWVNRGFSADSSVLTTHQDSKTPSVFTGYIQFTQKTSLFTPDNPLDRGEVYGLNLSEIRDFWSKQKGKPLPLRTDFYITLKTPPSPEGGITPLNERPVLRNAHFSYAVTWHLLGLVFMGMTAIYLIQNRHYFTEKRI